MVSERVEYYRSLLSSRSWHAEGLSWTVIQPAGSAATVEEVRRRLRAEPINLDEIRFPHVNDLKPDDPSPFLVAHLRQVGSGVVMFQANGFEGARPEVLRWLSDRARVHNVDWTINGNGGISYAVYGSLLAWVDKNDPDAVERGAPFDASLSAQAFRLHAVAPRGDKATAAGAASGRHIGPAFHAALARPHGDPLDSLSPAKGALSEQWPQLRRELHDLVSR